MKPKTEKILIALTCVLGISGVAYGMAEKNDPVFIAGLCFVIAGYLLIRRELKAYRKRALPR
ncbi:MAG: hypothetical protein JRD02_06765 [Deltaproteobacteria bacterium]|nr:hypothetical protein [Deltaproteobacteria bacterium]